MLTRATFLLLALTALCCNAQVPTAGCYPVQAWGKAFTAMPIDSGGVMIGLGGFYAHQGAAQLKVGPTGKYEATVASPSPSAYAVQHYRQTADGGYILIEALQVCDLFTGDSIYKYDEDGSLRWRVPFQMHSRAIDLQDSSVLLYSRMGGDLQLLWPDGSLNDSTLGLFTLHYLRTAVSKTGHSFFLAHESGLSLFDRHASSSWSTWAYVEYPSPFTFPVTTLHRLGPDSYLLTGEQHLYRMDSSMNLVDTLDLSAHFDSIAYMTLDSTGYYLQGVGVVGTPLALKASPSFTVLWTKELPSPIDYAGMIMLDSTMLLYGSHTFGRYADGNFSQQPVTLYLRPSDGHFPPLTEDLMVESVVVNSQEPWGPSLFVGLTVNVINNGPDTVRSMGITPYVREDGIFCSYHERHDWLQGLHLPPGDTLAITLDSVELHYALEFGTHRLLYDKVCVSVSGPNNHAEMDISNNVACATLTFVGTEDGRSPVGASAWPNPAAGEVMLSWGGTHPATCVWTDAQGRKVRKAEVMPGVQSISLNGLAGGLYTLVISNAQGESSRIKVAVTAAN